jgi:hypothetical protein
MEDRLKRLFGADKDREDPRRQAEMKIVWRLLDTVLEHGQTMLTAKRQERLTNAGSPSAAIPDLTDTERAIFNRPAYYGWTEGSIAGGLTFVVLFGGLRLAALRSGRTTAHIHPSSVRRNYSDLDLPTSNKTSARRGKGDSRRSDGSSSQQRQQQHQQQQQQQQQQHQQEGLTVGEDVMMQLQFMCTGAMALAVMSFTANLFADLPKFYRELSALPLQAGPSPFCHAMCPDLVQQMQQLRTKKINNNDNNGLDSDYNATEVSFEPGELLQDPITQELESMVHMVQNCQQRAALEQALRQTQGIEDSNQVMDIPAPGVPPNYLGVSVEGGGGDDDDGDDAAIANGDDWANGLVADREDNGGQPK